VSILLLLNTDNRHSTTENSLLKLIFSNNSYFHKLSSITPLVVFRIAFGIMLFLSTVRFWANGWIESLYIKPKYFFNFYGFEFVKPLGNYTYMLFVICAISAILVSIGYYYRIAIISLFLSFTYIELIDKTTYLNHYYFVSMVCLLMIFLPANAYFSLDSYFKKVKKCFTIPSWYLDALKFLVCILYFYAGIAKINEDWLLHALPLKIWLPARNDMPIIGFLFNYQETAFAFSWIGCIYDILIPFLLWNRFTRIYAYFAVIIFHALTSMLFPIGMFPYIMIVTALVFFSSDFHFKILQIIARVFNFKTEILSKDGIFVGSFVKEKAIQYFLLLFFTFQLLVPFRYLLYPGKLFWTEEGFRFSWRVMLIEKAGYAQFTIKDSKTEKRIVVDNSEFLTPFQEKMMSTQPDMILQYAHILRDYYSKNGFTEPKVFVDSYVALNGETGKPLIDPKVDLAKEQESFKHKKWILLY
jgi:hypothetical protein